LIFSLTRYTRQNGLSLKGSTLLEKHLLCAKEISQLILECTHEKADTSVVVHIMHCLTNGYKRIKGVSTD